MRFKHEPDRENWKEGPQRWRKKEHKGRGLVGRGGIRLLGLIGRPAGSLNLGDQRGDVPGPFAEREGGSYRRVDFVEILG